MTSRLFPSRASQSAMRSLMRGSTPGSKILHPMPRISAYGPAAARPFTSDRDGPKRYKADGELAQLEKTPIVSQLWDLRRKLLKNQGQPGDASAAAAAAAADLKAPPILLNKTVKSSRSIVSYEFRKNATLRHLYADSMGGIQIGKLLEDLDALAGNVAMQHCDDANDNTTPVNLVTASVDRIIQSHPLTMQCDYALVCQIAYVGRSSLDIIIRMHKVDDVQAAVGGEPSALGPTVLTSVFTFAARDYTTGKPKMVNRLVPETQDEIDLHQQREALAIQRKNSKKQGVRMDKELLTPLVERGAAVVDMPALAHPNAVLMSQTRLQNCFICEPQKVNFYGIIFGGYLMHQAYDLAVATSYTFAGVPPTFIEVEKVEFRKPVDIGDLVRLKSRVICSTDDPIRPCVHVEVMCQIVRPERASSYVSNHFTFIFGFRDNVTLRRVLPETFAEAQALVQASQWVHPDIAALSMNAASSTSAPSSSSEPASTSPPASQ